MIPDFSGDFVKFESTKDGDMFEILDEGKVEFSKALNKDMFNLKVKRDDKIMTYSPTNEAGKQLQDAFGEDSKSWIGQKFLIVHAAKKMFIKPVKTKKI